MISGAARRTSDSYKSRPTLSCETVPMELTPDGIRTAFTATTGLASADLNPIFDWFSIGVVHSVWRNGPIEDAHAGEGDLSDGEMFRINTWLTSQVREDIALWRDAGREQDISDIKPHEFQMLLDGIWSTLADQQSIMPNGRSHLQTAGVFLEPILNDIGRKLSSMGLFSDRLGPASAVYASALEGYLFCNSWWGTPKWPLVVDRFVSLLSEPEADHWAGRFGQLQPPPSEIRDRTALSATLKAQPWALSTPTCDWLAQAAIGYVRVE